MAPSANPPSLISISAVKTRGEVSCNGGERSGTILGTNSHKYKIATTLVIVTGMIKSNIPNSGTPKSSATLTTKRFVEVPIVVAIPPSKVASPIGNNVPEGERPVLKATLTKIGSNKTTIGVLFTKALRIAPVSNVKSKLNDGLILHNLASIRPIGSIAPVRTSA